VKFVSVYDTVWGIQVLYRLLKERSPEVNISHKEMPSFEEHEEFVKSFPYAHWYLIVVEDELIGAIYLTHDDEIGIFLFPEYPGKGYGPEAISLLTDTHRRARYLANINPANAASKKTFEKLGFKMIQLTYEKQT
jgi:RimJ/RimL family protein N-acetyltransferase